MSDNADIGVIGLAVMGENLVLNIESRGFKVAVFNRTTEKVDNFVNGRGKGKNIVGTKSLQEFVSSIAKPRKIMMMIKAGEAVDKQINALVDIIDEGDLLIDGGNSDFQDTERRFQALKKKNIRYMGSGVSGGEEGALKGPSIMPGGTKESWDIIKPIFTKIAAVADDGEVCCKLLGEGGAGHFVKMVHNGIEYGDMQLISESYHLMKTLLNMSNQEIADVFEKWNKGPLSSYLIDITYKILGYKDENNDYVLDKILDKVGQKGTGKLTAINSLELGSPLTLIGESVFSRFLISLKDDREEISESYKLENPKVNVDKEKFLADLERSLLASKMISYAQGFSLMTEADKKYKWNLNFGDIALVWRQGCIIRSVFLAKIKEAYTTNPQLINLILDPYFKEEIIKSIDGWRNVVSKAVSAGLPVPTLSSALSFFEGIRSAWLPGNMLQAQRDYFGAHMYERIDKKRGEFFHTNWTGGEHGAESSVYS